jgi:hypothetical protein
MTQIDPAKMTRVKAEKMVAATRDLELLKRLGDHKNKHVRAKAAYKAQKIADEVSP